VEEAPLTFASSATATATVGFRGEGGGEGGSGGGGGGGGGSSSLGDVVYDDMAEPGDGPTAAAAAAVTSTTAAAAAAAAAAAGVAPPGPGASHAAEAVTGWERPTVAVLSHLLVPLALWIVALSSDDLLHAALLLAFLLTLVRRCRLTLSNSR